MNVDYYYSDVSKKIESIENLANMVYEELLIRETNHAN